MSISKDNDLKTKAFFITCPAHEGKNGKIYSSTEAKAKLETMGVEISKEKEFDNIEKEIAESSYHGYASILFFLELECFHLKIQNFLDFVYLAIKRNSTLKYVTKFVVSYSFVEMSFGDTHWTVLLNGGKKRVNFKYPSIEKMKELYPDLSVTMLKTFEEMPGTRAINVIGDFPRYRTMYIDILRKEIRRDVPFIDNLIVVECVQFGFTKTHTILESIFENMLTLSKKHSVQEIVQQSIVACVDPEIYQEVATFAYYGNDGCYIYNINPALAIIINHQSFSNQLHLDFRDGSLNDVEALQKAFKSKKITSLTVSDGSHEDVQAIMRKVRTTNFKGINDLFIIIMSHGDEGDIIYTKTDSYSIRDDIVAPLLANPSLARVQKFVIVNACRGEVDPRFDNPEDVEKIRKSLPDQSTIYPRDDKLMMIFSTQKGFISLLFEEGAIFVQLFCDLFLETFDEKSMETLGAELQELMLKNLSDDQIPDFGITAGQDHNIKVQFVNFFNNYELLNDLAEYFKRQFKDNLAKSNSNLNKILEGSDIFREEQDRTLLCIAYVDGVDKRQVSKAQKESIEHFIESKQAKLMEGNKSCSTSQFRYEWFMDTNSRSSTVCVLKKSSVNCINKKL